MRLLRRRQIMLRRTSLTLLLRVLTLVRRVVRHLGQETSRMLRVLIRLCHRHVTQPWPLIERRIRTCGVEKFDQLYVGVSRLLRLIEQRRTAMRAASRAGAV